MSTFIRRGRGYKPDHRHTFGAEARDASHILGDSPPPVESDNDWQLVSILDQGPAPFCVAHGIGQAVRCNQVRNGVDNPRLMSRLWLMYLAHAIDHDTQSFDGTYIRNGFEVLERLGFPPEDAWPYDASSSGRYRVKPPQDVFRQAFDRIAPIDFRRILSVGYARVDDVKRALGAGLPVVFGTQVSNDFCDNIGIDKPLDPPRGKSVAGNHALIALSHNDDIFRVPNSWGTEWGQDGWCEMKADYIAASETVDVWICDFKGRQP